MTPDRARLQERKDQALRDLAALDRQVTAGEVAPRTAERLRARYETEAAEALTSLDALTTQDAQPEPDTGEHHEDRSPPRPSWRRPAAGILAGLVALAVTGVAVAQSIAPRPEGAPVTGNLPDQQAAAPASGRDLSKVSDAELEAVVAANPEVVEMRLALAGRYFDRQDYQRALEHYRAVLDRDRRHPEALAHLGWIAYAVTGRADLAADLLNQSMEERPDNAEALWLLGNVQLHGLKDPAAATATLQRLRRLPGLSATDRQQVDDALRQARAAASAGSRR